MECGRLPQLKIICLAHPATWIDAIGSVVSAQKKMLILDSNCQSWLNLDSDRGGRSGIYKVEQLAKSNHVLLRFISEGPIKEMHPSIEHLLAEDNCLPDNIEIPLPIPRSKKMFMFINLAEGIFYSYAPGMAPPLESILDILPRLEKDTHLPMTTAKIFAWKEKFVTTVTEVARRDGFLPYKVQAKLETATVTAVGDLENNEEWKKIEGAIDFDKWRAIAYVSSNEQGMFIFGLTKRRTKQISIPYMTAKLSMDDLLERILQVRSLLEEAIGCDVRQYCFREYIPPLTQFLNKNNHY